jgi:galactose mutarotase-like enzyme
MQTVILENELLRVTVLVDKGGDIIEFRHKPTDLDFLYLAPGGVRNPNRGVVSAPSGGAFLDYYSGGWNEILPNGGPLVNYKGAELGQHGEVSLIPWSYAILEDSPERVAVRMWVRPIRTPFFLEKTLSMEPGKPALMIEERLTNEGGETLYLMWGHHIAFGRPFLEEGTVIDAPASRFIVHEAMPGYEPRRFQPGVTADWPLIPTPAGAIEDASLIPAYGEAQAQEMAYLTDLSDGWYAITNPTRKVGFAIRFDPAIFPCIWYWQQLGNVANGYPWWGRTHVAALEPWSSYPTNGLNEAIANETALALQPGQQIETSLTAVAYQGLTRVHEVTAQGAVSGQSA